MKNFLLFIIGLILGFLVCYFINKDAEIEDEPEMVEETDMVVEEPVQEEKIAKPSGLVTPDEMRAMSKGYDTRYDFVTQGLKREDNRSSWYSLENIKAYLAYADSASTSQGYKFDGIRLYLGVHETEQGKPENTTLFISPTGQRMVGEGSFFNFNGFFAGSGDIPSVDGLNDGDDGDPPPGTYPQEPN